MELFCFGLLHGNDLAPLPGGGSDKRRRQAAGIVFVLHNQHHRVLTAACTQGKPNLINRRLGVAKPSSLLVLLLKDVTEEDWDTSAWRRYGLSRHGFVSFASCGYIREVFF